MILSPGIKLGPYEIVAPLGAGGMGEVYRARDTRLNRTVAVKILSSQLSSDPEARQRFEREARAISSLNHPHICALYDVGNQDGTEFLVMEFLEGETLADRLQKGPLALNQILKYGSELCDGLEQAHRSGVIHRDLKPGNIMLTGAGVKLMDFGLAKSVGAAAASSLTTTPASPAGISPVTEKGMIVGTFQYMSPEQVQGKEVDRRSDIFSLGAILYEMVTGRRAFEGESQLSVASAILERQPESVSTLKPMTPLAVDHAIRCCLAKDPEERWQTARDLALELKWIAESSTQSASLVIAGQRKPGRPWLAWSAAALLGMTTALAGFLYWNKRPPLASPVRFEIQLPADSLTFTLSPDGRTLAFISPGPDGHDLLWIRPLDSLEPRSLPGTSDILGPPVFWSPDSRFIAFQSGDKLKKIDVSGGPPQVICQTSAVVLGGAWSRKGTILFGTIGQGIMQVAAAGGAPTLVTTNGGRNEVHAFPSFLPDERHFVYLRAPESAGIYLGSLDVKPDQQSSGRIVATPLMAVYAPSADGLEGRLIYMREGSLLAQRFDERRLQPLGEPVAIAGGVESFLLSGKFSASASGALAYLAGKGPSLVSRLRWFDRQGKELGNGAEPGTFVYTDLALSPDATRVAATRIVSRIESSVQDIWLLDLVRGGSTRFTFDLAPDSSPIWSPDGKRIAFAATRPGGMGIYQKAANGAGQERRMVEATAETKFPNDWSQDGRFLLYTQQDPRTNTDLWVLPLATDGTPAGPATPFANTQFGETQGQFSPDGQWVAYTSDESGRSEIYVQPFPATPNGGSKTPVSRDGGMQPRWRRDGKELFYLSLDAKPMTADITPGPVLTAGIPRFLFAEAGVHVFRFESDLDVFRWSVTRDGKRFLIDTSTTSSNPVNVVLNWTAALKKD